MQRMLFPDFSAINVKKINLLMQSSAVKCLCTSSNYSRGSAIFRAQNLSITRSGIYHLFSRITYAFAELGDDDKMIV